MWGGWYSETNDHMGNTCSSTHQSAEENPQTLPFVGKNWFSLETENKLFFFSFLFPPLQLLCGTGNMCFIRLKWQELAKVLKPAYTLCF